MRSILTLLVVAGLAVTHAQEVALTLPENYRVQFENAWVKVAALGSALQPALVIALTSGGGARAVRSGGSPRRPK